MKKKRKQMYKAVMNEEETLVNKILFGDPKIIRRKKNKMLNQLNNAFAGQGGRILINLETRKRKK